VEGWFPIPEGGVDISGDSGPDDGLRGGGVLPLVPCLGSGDESEDRKEGLNGLHVEAERLYVAETKVGWLESDEMDELLWVSRWSTRVDVLLLLLEGGSKVKAKGWDWYNIYVGGGRRQEADKLQ
jgi:hypothetical protein